MRLDASYRLHHAIALQTLATAEWQSGRSDQACRTYAQSHTAFQRVDLAERGVTDRAARAAVARGLGLRLEQITSGREAAARSGREHSLHGHTPPVAEVRAGGGNTLGLLSSRDTD